MQNTVLNDLKIIVVIQKIGGNKIDPILIDSSYDIKCDFTQTAIYARNSLSFTITNLDPEIAESCNRMINGVPMGQQASGTVYGGVFVQLKPTEKFVLLGAKRMIKVYPTVSGDLGTTTLTTFQGYTGPLGNNVLGSVNLQSGNLETLVRSVLDISGQTTTGIKVSTAAASSEKMQEKIDFAYTGALAGVADMVIKQFYKDGLTMTSKTDASLTDDNTAMEVNETVNIAFVQRDDLNSAKASFFIDEGVVLLDGGGISAEAGDISIPIMLNLGIGFGDFIELKTQIRKDLNGIYKVLGVQHNVEHKNTGNSTGKTILKVSRRLNAF